MDASAAGPLAFIAKYAGFIIALGVAVRFGWMRRAKWMPPEEAIPDATAKVASLFTGVAIAFLYVFADRGIATAGMGWIAVVCFALTAMALGVTIYLSVTLSFEDKSLGKRVLGGFTLTEEAKTIRKRRRLEPNQLFENSHYNKDFVWTRLSQAFAQILVTFGFLTLQIAGSILLADGAILVSEKLSSGNSSRWALSKAHYIERANSLSCRHEQRVSIKTKPSGKSTLALSSMTTSASLSSQPPPRKAFNVGATKPLP